MQRKQASTIFIARNQMLKVKTNHKNKYKNNVECRTCGLINETQNHVLDGCLKLLKANRPHPRDYPQMPNDYRHTDNHLRLVMVVVAHC